MLNLRGNARTSGERRRAEGDNVFGQGSRAPVAITVLVRNANPSHEGCRILYRDIGDYLSRDDKLARLREWSSIHGMSDWEEITPDRHHDWIGQRDEAFQTLYALGSKATKAGKSDQAIFRLFSQGWQTVGDPYVYSYARSDMIHNARNIVAQYMGTLQVREAHPEYSVADAIRHQKANLGWIGKLERRLENRTPAAFSEDYIRAAAYRPFVGQWLYADAMFAHRPARTREIFPLARTLPRHASPRTNRAICLSGVGSVKPFSAILVDTVPDLELVSKGQCFPRFRYERRIASSARRKGEPPSRSPSSSPTEYSTSTSSSSASASRDQSIPPTKGMFDDADTELVPVDNITDAALAAFRAHYLDDTITKDAIFDYVYGVLHAPEYRARFASDLSKELPRVPMAPDFRAFADSGRALCDLHLSYETCEKHPLTIEFSSGVEATPEQYRLGTRRMRLIDDGKTLVVNEHVRLAGIPSEAHEYEVNGRTPLGWFIDRYHIKTDSKSGIVNDPNGWFDDPRDLVSAVRRIVHISVRTVAIVRSLPNSLADLAS